MKSNVNGELTMNCKKEDNLIMTGIYTVECLGPDGAFKWKDQSKNQLTNEGLQYMLDRILNTGSTIDPWYVGLYTGIVGSISDLIGTDIGGDLTEFMNYTGSRPAYSALRTDQTISNVLTKAEFAILGSATILGSFLASDNSGPASVLLSVGAYSSGSRLVNNGDTLRVTYELSATNG
jgi:hypothetical protein